MITGDGQSFDAGTQIANIMTISLATKNNGVPIDVSSTIVSATPKVVDKETKKSVKRKVQSFR
jgi:hypothetical protein